MSKVAAVTAGIEAADSLYDLAKKIGTDFSIPGKGLVVAIRNWTKYTFRFNFKVKRGVFLGASGGGTVHPYSKKNHGEHQEYVFKGKPGGGCNTVIELDSLEEPGAYYMRAAAARDGLNYVRFHANDRKGLDKMKKHRSGDGFMEPTYDEYYFHISISEDHPAICTVEIIPKGEVAPRS